MPSDDQTRIASAPVTVGPGTQLNGIYEIDERIAFGGMGEVYRGHNIQTDDPVAIKIVRPEFARDSMIVALFRKEAAVLSHLSHPAIVRYYVFTIEPTLGLPYLAMEYVDGESLSNVIKRAPMDAETARRLVTRIASGLAAAHEAGIVHRDLSPDNVILPGGNVNKAKIIDFGIAKAAAIGGGTLIGGRFAGTYNFVSPEQLGDFGGEITERSDIYSLGLVLAAVLRGAPLDMGGSQVDLIEKRRRMPDLTPFDPGLRPVLEAMLQPDPQNRPADMEAVVQWLSALAAPPAHAPLAERAPFGGPVSPAPGAGGPSSPPPQASARPAVEPAPHSSEPTAVSGLSAGAPTGGGASPASAPPAAFPEISARPGPAGPGSAWPGQASLPAAEARPGEPAAPGMR
ncbi:serine/threonine-protein kinase, partial [Propylenella binzhouense]